MLKGEGRLLGSAKHPSSNTSNMCVGPEEPLINGLSKSNQKLVIVLLPILLKTLWGSLTMFSGGSKISKKGKPILLFNIIICRKLQENEDLQFLRIIQRLWILTPVSHVVFIGILFVIYCAYLRLAHWFSRTCCFFTINKRENCPVLWLMFAKMSNKWLIKEMISCFDFKLTHLFSWIFSK